MGFNTWSFISNYKMGISQDSWHKRRKTGGRRPQPHKKRKFELGRPAAGTKIGALRVHHVRTREETANSEALEWTLVIFLGVVKLSPGKPVSLMSNTMHPTMSCLGLNPREKCNH